MKETIYNYDYLKDEDITEVVIRTKALIINNKNIILGNETWAMTMSHTSFK